MVSAEKIAVCQACGNEWEVRTPGTGKKRKCPICGKYRVKMKSELLAEEENAGEQKENPPEKTEENDPASENKQENTEEEKNGGGILLYAGLLILALSAGWFLWRSYRAKRAEREYYEDYGVNY